MALISRHELSAFRACSGEVVEDEGLTEQKGAGAWQWFWGGFGLGVLYQLIRNPQGCGCCLGVLALLLVIGLIAAWVFRDAVILIAGLGLLAYLGYRWWRWRQARN